jgi:hypothetical protein
MYIAYQQHSYQPNGNLYKKNLKNPVQKQEKTSAHYSRQ